MGDQWVCPECNYSTEEPTASNKCPFCKDAVMLNIGEVDEDLKPKSIAETVYDEDDLATPLEPPIDLDDDFSDKMSKKDEETMKRAA